jgi:lipoprotein NlpD
MALAEIVLACAPAHVSGSVREQAALPIERGHDAQTQSTFAHRVEKGQTLYRIARAYSVTVEQLMRANAIDDPRELQEGEYLTVPNVESARTVSAHDSPEPTPLPRAMAALPKGAPALAVQNPKAKPRPAAVKVGRVDGILGWPVRGVLYARFGTKGHEPHDGIDLAAPAGTPVTTAAAGKVLYAGEQKGYGLIVIVEHERLVTVYAHNRDVRVKTGQVVRAGQVVSTVGDSGRTSGPHLHFEVRRDGRPVDPLDYLGPVPQPETRVAAAPK